MRTEVWRTCNRVRWRPVRWRLGRILLRRLHKETSVLGVGQVVIVPSKAYDDPMNNTIVTIATPYDCERAELHDDYIVVAGIDSTSVRKFLYDLHSQSLMVEFQNETTYCYWSVPLSAVRELLGTHSVGKALNEFVKPHYEYKKMEV